MRSGLPMQMACSNSPRRAVADARTFADQLSRPGRVQCLEQRTLKTDNLHVPASQRSLLRWGFWSAGYAQEVSTDSVLKTRQQASTAGCDLLSSERELMSECLIKFLSANRIAIKVVTKPLVVIKLGGFARLATGVPWVSLSPAQELSHQRMLTAACRDWAGRDCVLL